MFRVVAKPGCFGGCEVTPACETCPLGDGQSCIFESCVRLPVSSLYDLQFIFKSRGIKVVLCAVVVHGSSWLSWCLALELP